MMIPPIDCLSISQKKLLYKQKRVFAHPGGLYIRQGCVTEAALEFIVPSLTYTENKTRGIELRY